MSKRRTSFSDRDPIRSEKTEGGTKSSGVRRSSEKAGTGEGDEKKSSGPNNPSLIVWEGLRLSGLSKKPEGFLEERKTEGGRGREERVSGVNEREERRAGDTSSSSSSEEMKKEGARKSLNNSFWSCESMRELTDVLLFTGGGTSRSDVDVDDDDEKEAETTFLALSCCCCC